jgi:hypothetical protein
MASRASSALPLACLPSGPVSVSAKPIRVARPGSETLTDAKSGRAVAGRSTWRGPRGNRAAWQPFLATATGQRTPTIGSRGAGPRHHPGQVRNGDGGLLDSHEL